MEIPDNFVDISTLSDKGLFKKIKKEGAGEAKPKNGATVYVHYVGTFFGGEKDGEKFDSSKDRESLFSFVLGEGKVIKGWDTGIPTMKKNEICELICAPEYGYGDKGTGTIPANSYLKFEIELFDWKGKDISPKKDGTLIQTIIVSGTGFDSPKDCVPVKVSIKGFYNDNIFDERDVEFEMGDCTNSGLIPAIELAVRKMKKNERSMFDVAAEYAFGTEGSEIFNIPPNAEIKYEIVLKDFEKIKESYSIDSCKEKLQYSENFKVRATEKFQNGKFVYSSKLYGKAASYIEYDTDFTEEDDKVSRKALLLSLRLNLALCHIKLGDSVSSIAESDKALELDATNEKGLYRRAQALILNGDYEAAKQSLKTLLVHNDNNKQAIVQLRLCEAKIKENFNLEKKLYQTMLSKIGQGGHSDGDTANDELKEDDDNQKVTEEERQSADEEGVSV